MVINIGDERWSFRYLWKMKFVKSMKRAVVTYLKSDYSALLTEEEIIMMCEVVTKAGAEFIKTSTGFSTAGATFEHVALMKKHVAKVFL